MITYCTYDGHGSVLQMGRCQKSLANMISDDVGGRFMEVDAELYAGEFVERYVVTPERGEPCLRDKTSIDTAHDVSGLTLTLCELPPGAIVKVGGSQMVADGTSDTVQFDQPGHYVIEIIAPSVQYRDAEIEVHVG